MNVLSLFSGIGGLDLGLERAGMTVVGQVEIDPWCRKVLAKHWPEVPRHDDVRTAAGWWLGDVADATSARRASREPGESRQVRHQARRPQSQRLGGEMANGKTGRDDSDRRPAVDLVCGGFPCQPVSSAGRRRAQDDPRWLWPAMAEVIRRLQPRYALMENVPGLLALGMGDVLGDLAACGYDTEWDCVPASAVGAPHRRDRVWVVAYPASGGAAAVQQPGRLRGAEPGSKGVAHANGTARPPSWPTSQTVFRPGPVQRPRRRSSGGWDYWATEPDVGRVAHGIPRRVDRLRGLGNAVVPQVAEHIGRLILAGAA